MENGNVGASVVVLLVKYYKQKMVALLKRNGVNVPDRASDNDIIMLVTATLKSSNAFRKDVKKFISNPRVLASLFSQFKNFTDDSKFFGFTEEADYFRFTEEADYFRMDGYKNATGFAQQTFSPNLNLTSQYGLDFSTPTTPSTTSTEQPKQTGSFWSKAFDFVNKGIDTFVTLDTNKTNRAIADSQTKVNDSSDGGVLNLPPQKNNTTTYVILGIVGVALLGAVIYFASKKRN